MPRSDEQRSEADNAEEDLKLNQAFETCRTYLKAIAIKSLEPRYRAKISTSDLLQQTYLEAHRDFHRFRGETDIQVRAWLRRILLNNISNTRRRFRSEKRNADREGPLPTPPLRGREKTPSSIASSHEEVRLLECAMKKLSADHRTVITLRNLDRKPFCEIGIQLGRSDEAARKLWFRAMKELKAELKQTRLHAQVGKANPTMVDPQE